MVVSWSLMCASKAPKGADKGGSGLGPMDSYKDCVVAEYVWLDAEGNTRSKTKTITCVPTGPQDLPVWNFDGSSTDQAPGDDSEVLLYPVAVFRDPFRLGQHVIVLAECIVPITLEPARGNHRAHCKAMHDKYESHDPWYGIEQEYTLMKPAKNGEKSKIPYGFNQDGTEPAPQGPYYCSAGQGCSIGREVAEVHYAKCLYAGVKIAGVNAEVMPGQWEYQIGPCKGMTMGDHLTMSRYLMQRVAEELGIQVSFDPKPMDGDWNGAGCHTNFSTKEMRADGGYEVIKKVCEAMGPVAAEHIAAYGEGNDKRLTGRHETADINTFKWGVADRGASIRIPRDTEKFKKGYMEDRRPAANADPYRVCGRILETAGPVLDAL